MMKKWLKQEEVVKSIALLLAIVISMAVISPILSSPKAHVKTLKTIDRNKEKATALSLTVTLASTALSLMPDDTASPLANELSDLSTPLLLIACILYFEQFMLTSMEYLAFGILVPLALVLLLISIHIDKRSLIILARKLLLIALVCAVVVPFSAAVTNMIETSFAESINVIDEKIDKIHEAFSKIVNGEEESNVLSFISNVATGITSMLDFAKEALGLLIDAVAILIVTSCVIPVITLLLFVWCIKSIIAGNMENFGDTTITILKKLPMPKKIITLRVSKKETPSLPE